MQAARLDALAGEQVVARQLQRAQRAAVAVEQLARIVAQVMLVYHVQMRHRIPASTATADALIELELTAQVEQLEKMRREQVVAQELHALSYDDLDLEIEYALDGQVECVQLALERFQECLGFRETRNLLDKTITNMLILSYNFF